MHQELKTFQVLKTPYLIDKMLGFSTCLQFPPDDNQKDLSIRVFSSFILNLLFVQM